MAVEQRIRLTAMIADAAPPSLWHALCCHEYGRGRRQLLVGTGASLDYRTHRLLSRPGHGEHWESSDYDTTTARSFEREIRESRDLQTPETDTSKSSIVVSSHYTQRGPLSPT